MSDIYQGTDVLGVGGNAVSRVPMRDSLPAWLIDSPALPVAPEPAAADCIPVESLVSAEPEVTITVADVADFTCDRCGAHEYRDVPVHDGHSVRRDCAVCNRTFDFVVWNPKGQQ